ncbi:MAG: abortive infection family protein [Phycisphaeraceae bacterium]|nr:abortive infection family protein [Phycisphaeraceae bacterium]
MAGNPLFSLSVVTALNRLVGGFSEGDEWLGMRINTHAALDDFFGALGIAVAAEPSINKKIRATIQRLNANPTEYKQLIAVIEQLADPRNHQFSSHQLTLDHLNSVLRGDGYEARLVGEKYRVVSTGLNAVAAAALTETVDALDLQSVQADFERAISDAEADPAGALTSACSTVESVCKCILDGMDRPYPNKEDISHLSNEVAKHLGLSPARTDLPPLLAQDLKQVLGGLQSVAGGIGALRTHFGDAHGKGKARAPIDSRIARLAIHAASTLSLFYIETWQRMAKTPSTKVK